MEKNFGLMLVGTVIGVGIGAAIYFPNYIGMSVAGVVFGLIGAAFLGIVIPNIPTNGGSGT